MIVARGPTETLYVLSPVSFANKDAVTKRLKTRGATKIMMCPLVGSVSFKYVGFLYTVPHNVGHCERCDTLAALTPVELQDGTQKSLLCDDCVPVVIAHSNWRITERR